MIGPVRSEGNALAVGQPHLLADDVAEGTLHLAQRDLSGDAGVFGSPRQRSGDIAFVDPEVEHPDLQESSVGGGTRRRPRGALEICFRQRGQILAPPVVDRTDPFDEVGVAQAGGLALELACPLERGRRRDVLGKPAGKHGFDAGDVTDHGTDIPVRAK